MSFSSSPEALVQRDNSEHTEEFGKRNTSSCTRWIGRVQRWERTWEAVAFVYLLPLWVCSQTAKDGLVAAVNEQSQQLGGQTSCGTKSIQLGCTRYGCITIPTSDCKGNLSPSPTPLLCFRLPNFGQVSLLANPNLSHPRNRCLRNTVPCLTELTWHNPTTSQQCNETDIIILIFQKRKQRLVRLY